MIESELMSPGLPTKDPIERPDLYTEVTTRLARLVATAQPGERLPPERILAATYGVGRSTVREALRTLVFMGAVRAVQGDGMYVGEGEDLVVERLFGLGLIMNRSSILEIVETREMLETEVVKLAAIRRTEDDINRLQGIMAEMRSNISNPKRASLPDLDFHVTLARASNNRVLEFCTNGMRSLLESWMDKAVNSEEIVIDIVAEHQAILHAVISGDGDEASEAMALHLRNASERLLNAIGSDASLADHIGTLLRAR